MLHHSIQSAYISAWVEWRSCDAVREFLPDALCSSGENYVFL